MLHRRLGHASDEIIKKTVQQRGVVGMEDIDIIATTTYTMISICIITIVIVTIVVSLTDLINTIIMICMSLHTITVILLITLVIVMASVPVASLEIF